MTKDQLQTCFLQYRDSIHKYCCRQINNTTDAEDILMSVFLELAQKVDAIDYLTAENYLRRSVRNKVIDYKRKKIYWCFLELFDVSAAQRPNDLWVHKHDACVLIQSLPEKMREAIKLQYIDGYSREEVASIIGSSPNTIRNNISAGMKKLKTIFKNS